MSLLIDLIERGQPQVVSSKDWQQYDLEPAIRALAALRIVRLIRSQAGVIVVPGNQVGEMRLPDAVLRIVPKSPRLMAAMESLALRAQSRTARHFEHRSGHTGRPGADPAGAFVNALLTCIREGVPWKYETATETTSHPRGKFVVGATMRFLMNRGLQHRTVVQFPIRRQNVELVRVARAAYAYLPEMLRGEIGKLAQAETLIGALDHAQPYASLGDAINAAGALDAESASLGRAGAELGARSLDLLLRQAALGGEVRNVPGGIARFTDLENLWERCVLLMVERTPILAISGSAASFHGLAGTLTKLFADGGPELDPDVIVSSPAGILAVIDAKYKRLEQGTAVSAPDLYQLTCYVQRTDARLGMLVHFSEETARAAFVGTTDTGAGIVSLVVSPELLLSVGENALDRLFNAHPHVAERAQQSFAHGFSQQRTHSIPDLASDIFLGALEDERIREGL